MKLFLVRLLLGKNFIIDKTVDNLYEEIWPKHKETEKETKKILGKYLDRIYFMGGCES